MQEHGVRKQKHKWFFEQHACSKNVQGQGTMPEKQQLSASWLSRKEETDHKLNVPRKIAPNKCRTNGKWGEEKIIADALPLGHFQVKV